MGRKNEEENCYRMTSRKGIYWKLKEEVLDRILWRTGFGRGYALVVRETT